MGTSDHKDGRTPPASQDWASASSPNGYDQPEFGPKQAPRDYPKARKTEHGAENERHHLRTADAAMEGNLPPSKPADDAASGRWDQDDDRPIDPSRRLYKD